MGGAIFTKDPGGFNATVVPQTLVVNCRLNEGFRAGVKTFTLARADAQERKQKRGAGW